jgi:hypothetical protein
MNPNLVTVLTVCVFEWRPIGGSNGLAWQTAVAVGSIIQCHSDSRGRPEGAGG